MAVSVLSSFLILLALAGCSHTPGDAAYRLGHPTAAADLYKRGAELGDAEAALKLGLIIMDNEVSPQNYGEAVMWFEKACGLDEAAGCHNAGVSYEYGNGGAEKDLDKAFSFYSRAAEQGFMQAQYNLASLYSNNYVAPPIEGYKWMLLAQKQANACRKVPLCQWILEDPPGHRQKLESQLSREDKERAQQAAASWKRKR